MELESRTRRPSSGRSVTKPRPRRTRSAGQAMSLDQLDDWLDALDPPAKVDGAFHARRLCDRDRRRTLLDPAR